MCACGGVFLLHGSKKNGFPLLFPQNEWHSISFPQKVYYTNIHKVIADVQATCLVVCPFLAAEYIIF